MMDMVRYDIDLFTDCFDDEILGEETPETISKLEGLVGAIAMVPNRTMRSHNDHAVENDESDKFPGEIIENKHIQKREHADDH
jgi:hypothetical protein